MNEEKNRRLKIIGLAVFFFAHFLLQGFLLFAMVGAGLADFDKGVTTSRPQLFAFLYSIVAFPFGSLLAKAPQGWLPGLLGWTPHLLNSFFWTYLLSLLLLRKKAQPKKLIS